jgi:ferritin
MNIDSTNRDPIEMQVDSEYSEPKSFFSILEDEILDEYNGVIKYCELAKDSPDPGYSQILRDMAKEEHRHAMHLISILKDGGCYTETPEIKKLAEEASKALYPN